VILSDGNRPPAFGRSIGRGFEVSDGPSSATWPSCSDLGSRSTFGNGYPAQQELFRARRQEMAANPGRPGWISNWRSFGASCRRGKLTELVSEAIQYLRWKPRRQSRAPSPKPPEIIKSRHGRLVSWLERLVHIQEVEGFESPATSFHLRPESSVPRAQPHVILLRLDNGIWGYKITY